jgi:hypothetical protein
VEYTPPDRYEGYRWRFSETMREAREKGRVTRFYWEHLYFPKRPSDVEVVASAVAYELRVDAKKILELIRPPDDYDGLREVEGAWELQMSAYGERGQHKNYLLKVGPPGRGQ